MALELRLRAKKNTWKHIKPARNGVQKEFKYRHCSMRTWARMGQGSRGLDCNYAYVKFNLVKWLNKYVGQPVDKVYSKFVEEYNKSEHRYGSPKELFYLHIDRKKGENTRYYGLSKFFVSSDGTLCKYPNRTTYKNKWRRKQPPKSHVEFNENVLKDLKIDQNNYGPIYLGKLWATAKGMTKVMNVWLVRESKLTGKSEFGGIHNVSKAERSNLESFTTAIVEGYGSVYKVKQSMYSWVETVNYRFIVKLSDLKI